MMWRELPDICEGHGVELRLADLVVNIGFVGRGRRPFQYALCIECAEAHFDTVQEWEDADQIRIRDYWWAKHRNCEV